MGVYISGLEMPQDGRITLQIDSNGGVYVVNKFSITAEKYEKSMPAAEIPPHGRLGDLDALVKALEQNRLCYVSDIDDESFELGTNRAIDAVQNANTIIEAERTE